VTIAVGSLSGFAFGSAASPCAEAVARPDRGDGFLPDPRLMTTAATTASSTSAAVKPPASSCDFCREPRGRRPDPLSFRAAADGGAGGACGTPGWSGMGRAAELGLLPCRTLGADVAAAAGAGIAGPAAAARGAPAIGAAAVGITARGTPDGAAGAGEAGSRLAPLATAGGVTGRACDPAETAGTGGAGIAAGGGGGATRFFFGCDVTERAAGCGDTAWSEGNSPGKSPAAVHWLSVSVRT